MVVVVMLVLVVIIMYEAIGLFLLQELKMFL